MPISYTGRHRRAGQGAAVVALLALLALLGMVSAARGLGPRGAPAQRPSFIVIQTDDQTIQELDSTWLTPMGLRARTMPHTIDLIRRRGIDFRRYYVSYPLCCPSRASLLTGRYAHNTRVLGNLPPNGGFSAFQSGPNYRHNVATWLDGAGYRTIHLGKFLNNYGSRGNAETTIPPGWDRWETLTPAGESAYFYGYHLNVNGHAEGPFGDPEYGLGAGEDDRRCRAWAVPGLTCNFLTDSLTRRAVTQIERTPASRPFYLQLDYTAPHGDPRPPIGPEPAARHYDSAQDTPLPRPLGFDEADVSDKPEWIRSLSRFDQTSVRRIRKEYRKSIEAMRAVDDGVASLISALRRTRRLANTYVLFTTDNGFFTGEHRIERGKFLPYEPALHLPLLIRGPGIRPGSRSSELVANVDITPTVLRLAGVRADRSLDGRPLEAFWRDTALRTRRPILLESFLDPVSAPAERRGPVPVNPPHLAFRGVRLGPYSYVEYGSGARELYDLSRDPGELRNQRRRPPLRPGQGVPAPPGHPPEGLRRRRVQARIRPDPAAAPISATVAGTGKSGDQPFTTADEPGPDPDRTGGPDRRRQAGVALLALGALGVVFGDIGTSPLYALQTVFSADNHAVKPTETDVYGVISLVFWSVTLIVSIEFVCLIMRADNDGEGGIMALTALLETLSFRRPRAKTVLIALGMFGVALFYGDGMITPAISVLSAVEGVKVATPGLSSIVVPVTIAVLAVLFSIQRFGTHRVGGVFGPVMLVWFAAIAAAGLARVLAHPTIVKALSPQYGVEFFSAHLGIAFVSLSAIVLTITGAEALYADMGHFGRPPITRAWFFVVFPALTLNYMGQGSLILGTPSAIDNPFFLLVPHWLRIPLVVLATVATVIASQAVISGAFSVTRQAIQLGFLPRLSIRHTSAREIGQVYAPAINWVLFVAVVGLVVGFGSSTKLASAYGIAVTGTITVDTVLFFVVVRMLWRKPTWVVAAGAVFFGTIDLAFLGANVGKIVHGAWFPLSVGVIVFVILNTWKRGAEALHAAREEKEGALADFVREVRAMDPPVARVPGTAVYLNARRETTPLALQASLRHFRVLHQTVVIFSIESTREPHVRDEERLTVDSLGFEDDGIAHLTARVGFQDTPDVPFFLRLASELGIEAEIDVQRAIYFVSHGEIEPTPVRIGTRWRKRLFTAMARNSASPVEYFRLPPESTINVAVPLEL